MNRRTLLRGMAGATAVSLALPVLEAMLDDNATALANGDALPCRLVTFCIGNGVHLDRWIPATTGPSWELTDQLMPLAAVKEYCSVISGYRHLLTGANGHTNGLYGSFCGHPPDYYDPENNLEARPTGPTIDQVAADIIGQDSYLRSLEIGNSKRTPGGPGKWMSHRGPNQPNRPIFNPQQVYQRLFVGPDESDELRVSMLDAVKADADALRGKLGHADKLRLDAHLQSVWELEKRITSVPPACNAPPPPSETNEDVLGQEPLEETARAMADLLAVAFSCDLVRVCAFQQSGTVCQSIFTMTGATVEHHALTHESGAQAQALVHEAVMINMEAFAYLLDRFRNTPDGDGNLLDHSVVMLGSDVAEGLTHSNMDMPFIVAGRAGGRLTHPGVHVRSPNNGNCSDILLTVLRAVAPEIASVGAGPGYSEQTVSALMA